MHNDTGVLSCATGACRLCICPGRFGRFAHMRLCYGSSVIFRDDGFIPGISFVTSCTWAGRMAITIL